MRKISIFTMAAAFVLGFASCSKDVDMGSNAGTEGNAAFQFALKTAKGNYVTYADIASVPEWAVSDVSMYIFNAETGDPDEGKLVGTNADFDETTNSADHGAAVLTAKEAWLTANKGKAVNVYFVGNEGANSADGTAHASLAAVGGTTMESAFVELLTDVQDNDGTTADKLTTPLLFSAASTVTVPSMGKVVVPVSLKRREARFDIVNTKVGTFNIDKVVIKNAAVEGYIFADNTATSTAGLNHKNIEEITTIPTADVDGLSASVFYLYPTQLGVGANTEIAIVATVDGKQSAYPVNSTAQIEANKRYKLVLKDTPYGLVFDVVVADYEDGDDLDVVPLSTLSMSGLSIASGNAVLDNINSLIHIMPNDGASTVSLTTFASSNAGVSVTTENILGTGPAIAATTNTTDATITYSTIGYKTSLVITIPEYTGDKSFQTLVTIKDKTVDASATIVVYHETGDLVEVEPGVETYIYPLGNGQSLPAVKVGGLYWAPVNVGATSVDGTLEIKDLGYLFQYGNPTPFSYNVTPAGVKGPVSLASLSGVNKGKFVEGGDDSVGDWMIYNAQDIQARAENWNPCPKGWKVPTSEEMGVIHTMCQANLKNRELDKFRFYLLNEDGDKLYFPGNGRILRDGGYVDQQGENVRLWTSDTVDNTGEGGLVRVVGFNSNIIGTSGIEQGNPGHAYGVRCVKVTE